MDRFDVVLFGCSGYTGRCVLEELFRQSKKEKFTFAVAGRNEKKIKEGLNDSAVYLNEESISDIPIIEADVSDTKSLSDMAKRAKILINCVGPFRFFGESVVKACVENGTHHVDVSGEPQYLESMQLLYNAEAESKGCYVVGSCGFDSIPAEMGVKYIRELFNGAINDVDAYVNNRSHEDMKIHYGTWESAIYGFAHRKELSGIRKRLLTQRVPKPKFPQSRNSFLFYSNDIRKWCLPFPGSDRSVVIRSQNFLHFESGLRPIQFNPYLSLSSWFLGLITILLGITFGIFSSFQCGRNLLLKYPKLFSAGLVSKEGASRKALENSKMELIFVGRGWDDKSSVDVVKTNKKIICSVTGPEGGYISCSIFIVQAAITILKERERMPSSGGVYSPGAAFDNTTYMERLQNNGINFNKLSESSF